MKVVLSYSCIALFSCFTILGRCSKPALFYFYDPHSNIKIEKTDSINWQPYQEGQSLKFGYNSNGTAWCKLVLPSSFELRQNYWVFDNIHLDSLVIYSNKKIYQILGDRTQQHSPFLNVQAISLSNLPQGEKVVLIAAVKKQWTHLDFIMTLEKAESIYSNSNFRLALYFSFIGFALLLLILTVYIYISTRRIWYLLYILYSAMGLLYLSVNLGILRNFVFRDFIYFSEVRIYTSCYWFILLGLFLSETLELKKNQPGLNRTFNLIQSLVFGFSLYCLLCLGFGWDKALSYSTKGIFFLFFINILLILLGIYKSIQQKHPLAIYIVISFLPHIFWGLSLIFDLAGFIKEPIKIDWINWIVMYEMVFFGWVLIKEYIEAFRKNKKLQEQIIHDEKRALLSIEKARLKERQQISELLHDKIGIDIARTIHALELGQKEKTKAYLFELGKDIRNLSHTILPKELEDGALWSAIGLQIEIIRSQGEGIKVSLETYDFPQHLDKELAKSLYLIIIELIQNAIKHSFATLLRIELFGYPDVLVFTVSDNGKGFDSKNKEGFGLQTIKRRVKEFSGEFEITSTLEEGTSALITIPRI
jgi:signal transduction histidine kinase